MPYVRKSARFGTMAHPRRYPPGSVPADLFTREKLLERTHLNSKKLTSYLLAGVGKPAAFTTDGKPLYDYDCVDRLVLHARKEKQGSRAAGEDDFATEDSIAVFKALKEGGKSLIDITLETGVDPRDVEAIAKRYAHMEGMTGGFFLSSEQLRAICQRLVTTGHVNASEEGKVFTIDNPDELVEIVRVLTKPRRCKRCRAAEPSDECAECTVKSLEREIAKLRANASDSRATAAETNAMPSSANGGP